MFCVSCIVYHKIMPKPLILENIHTVHLTGIKGVGMTALACCFQDLGVKITGSDVAEVFVTDEVLKKRQISFKIGFSAKNLGNPDLLITTGAHGGLLNPEVKAAKKRGIPIMTHGEALGFLMKGKRGISFCGVGANQPRARWRRLFWITPASHLPTPWGWRKFFPSVFRGDLKKKVNFSLPKQTSTPPARASIRGLVFSGKIRNLLSALILNTIIRIFTQILPPLKKLFFAFFQKFPYRFFNY